jgi:hypothetical protein
MSFKNLSIVSIDQLLSTVSELDSNLIFRGVTDQEKHSLIPTAGRWVKGKRRRAPTATEEKRLLWKFRDRVRPHVSLSLDNLLEWMILGQHHGLPMRLLDWTSSPLVALFFAVNKVESRLGRSPNGQSKLSPIDGCIYAVKRPPKIAPSDRTDPYKVDRVKLIDPPHISQRIPSQSGLLTIHPNSARPWAPKSGYRILIPHSHKMNCKFDLDRLGINQASLFPGLDAVAGHLNWEFQWGKH